MSSLSHNFRQLFLALVAVGAALLLWVLLDQWHRITDRHEIRQRSQIVTLASATRKVMASQELVLDMVGRELLQGALVGDRAAAVAELDRLRALNPVVAAYAFSDLDGNVVLGNSDLDTGRDNMPNLLQQDASRATFLAALGSDRMVIGQPYRIPVLDQWAIPVRKAIRDGQGQALGVMTAALQLGGNDPFFEQQFFLGPRNTLQIVRGADLFPLHWAASMAPPEGYYTRPIPREFYDRAVASAERRSGYDIEQIRSDALPVPYRVVNALGPHLGYTVYDPVYDFWVLTQTHRKQLLGEFIPIAVASTGIFALLLTLVLLLLRVIARAEALRQRELVHHAEHDLLTGLPNRMRMASDFERLRDMNDGRLSLLFLDLDNFKAFNDGFGHVLGDTFLRELGKRLTASLRPRECAARIGGDEFVLMTPETGPEQLEQRARELIEVLTAPCTIEGLRCEVGCSVGVARTPEAGETINDLLRAADVAMYAAKRQASSVCHYHPALGRNYLENIRIERHLRAALDAGKIDLHYQPQVDRNGALLGFEALARWTDPELGEVAPERFVAIAEASGQIARLGDYIVERALEDGRTLQALVGRPFRLSVNVSVRQFRSSGFAPRLVEHVAQSGLHQVQIVLEITESLFMEDHEPVIEALECLRMAEIRVALDDFGTGFSALGLLRSLPIDELKIDRSFVESIETDQYTRKLIQSIIGIGRGHGMSLLAEGVETPRQLEMLVADGCDAFQGYLFARSMSIEELRRHLASANGASFAPG
jgi:diguanylate cyclase (GGDEF)-like protein